MASVDLLDEVVALRGSNAAAAVALGVTKQHIGRVREGTGKLGIVATVRAAILTGRDPLRALREDGNVEAADVLAEAFGERVTAKQRAILQALDRLPARRRKALLEIITEPVETAPKATPSRSRRPKSSTR